jgi:NAD+ synthase
MGCDMNPIAHLTCGQVIEIGMELARDYDIMLDTKYIQRPPADGLTGKTDEDNFGFTYDQLDAYILNGTSGNKKIDKKIEKMHEAALHKLTMPATMEMEGL